MITLNTLMLVAGLQTTVDLPKPYLPFVTSATYGSESRSGDGRDSGNKDRVRPKIHSVQLLKLNKQSLKIYTNGSVNSEGSYDGFDGTDIYIIASTIEKNRALVHHVLYDMSRLSTSAERKKYLTKMINRLNPRVEALQQKIDLLDKPSDHLLSEASLADVFFATSKEDRQILRKYFDAKKPLQSELNYLSSFVRFLEGWRENPQIGPKP